MLSTKVYLLAVALTCRVSVVDQVADLDRQIGRIIEQYNALTAAGDANGLLSLYHDQLDYPSDDPNTLRREIERTLESRTRLELLEVFLGQGQSVGARVRYAGDFNEPSRGSALLVLRAQAGNLRICGAYQEADPNSFDRATGIYTSREGRFSLRIPQGWVCVDASSILGGLVPASVIVLAPDLRSSVIMGLVELPLRLGPDDASSAQKAVEADTAMERRFTGDHRVLERGPTQVAGRQGYRQICQFAARNHPGYGRRRMRVYLCEHPMLYFFLCDAIPPDAFDRWLPQFDAIVSSLTFLPAEGHPTVQEAVAAGLAKGQVTGNVYTCQEYNCFIAAPPGWEISTSANPAHLVQMQYTKGRSLARLIGAKGLDPNTSCLEAFTRRLDSLTQVVADFNEVSRTQTTLAGIPAVESVQTFSVEGLGRFHIKEVTAVRDSTYYLILCQCIEPDDFKILEQDFDLIIQSFGFIH